jgi:hypothetical protein
VTCPICGEPSLWPIDAGERHELDSSVANHLRHYCDTCGFVGIPAAGGVRFAGQRSRARRWLDVERRR